MQLMTLHIIIIVVIVVGLQRNLHLAEIQVLYNILPPPPLSVTSAAAVDETLNFSQSRAIYERAFLCKTATLRKRAWTTKALPYTTAKISMNHFASTDKHGEVLKTRVSLEWRSVWTRLLID